MSAVPPPPWQGQAPEAERTPEGQEIIRTRFGPHIRDEAGRLVPYQTEEALAARIFGPKPRGPWVLRGDWSVWNS